MEKVTIVGKGNVGTHLFKAFGKSRDIEVSLVNSRTLEDLDGGASFIILAVSDTAIASTARKIKEKTGDYKGIVAHTSGSMPITCLEGIFENYGIFYPLQTFSLQFENLEYSEIPFFIEGNSVTVAEDLKELAQKISRHIYDMDSDRRRWLHVASVFACNFTNALYGVAGKLLERRDIPFEVLLPLIRQTARKVEILSPKEAQTGPAKRGDRLVMDRHLEMLENLPVERELYKKLSDLISDEQDRL